MEGRLRVGNHGEAAEHQRDVLIAWELLSMLRWDTRRVWVIVRALVGAWWAQTDRMLAWRGCGGMRPVWFPDRACVVWLMNAESCGGRRPVEVKGLVRWASSGRGLSARRRPCEASQRQTLCPRLAPPRNSIANWPARRTAIQLYKGNHPITAHRILRI